MVNPIDSIFSPVLRKNPGAVQRCRGQRPRLMTHVVAGYPDIETSERLVEIMAANGADLVEIQIPFSDPLADGPTIITASQAALDNGITPRHCFSLAEGLSKKIKIPLLLMTYGNIPYRMGMEVFMRRCCDSGISGVIVPDLPFDENSPYIQTAKEFQIHPIPVVSPGMDDERLRRILPLAAGFIYVTLRVGITGARKSVDQKGLIFLEKVRQMTSLPIFAGFGISSPEMAAQLEDRADGIVIGSHILNLFDQGGSDAVAAFIRSLF
jgi:tryptophan synthase alpha chain